MVKIIFGEDKNSFILTPSMGPNPKYNFEKYLILEILYDKLETTHFEIVILKISNLI